MTESSRGIRPGGLAALIVSLTVIASNGYMFFFGNTIGRSKRWGPPGRTENLFLAIAALAVTVLLGGAILSKRDARPELARQLGLVYFIVAFALAIASWWLS